MVIFCSGVFWVGLFGLFFNGFRFIAIYLDLANTIVEYIFSMFFLSLMVMLFFSTGILTYTGLFQSREAAYLLTTPASADRLFAYKFVEAMGFSSWGFLLLGSPMMVAYGMTVARAGGILWNLPRVFTGVRVTSRRLGCHGRDPCGELFPKTAEDGSHVGGRGAGGCDGS